MKIKQTLKEYKCAVFCIGFAASIPLIIFMSTLMGDRCQAPESTSLFLVRCGHVFTNWLYDYQTLITGVLATFAAAWTINTMRESTREQINALEAPLKKTVERVHNIIIVRLGSIENQYSRIISIINSKNGYVSYEVLLEPLEKHNAELSRFLDTIAKFEIQFHIGTDLADDAIFFQACADELEKMKEKYKEQLFSEYKIEFIEKSKTDLIHFYNLTTKYKAKIEASMSSYEKA